MRMCVACRQMKPKIDLIRVVKTPEGEIVSCAAGKLNGRGAYVCKDKECIERAKKTGALSRALEATISDDIYASLKKGCEDLD
ncbi:MAG: YlxR family protein [Clostridia bacterium]|nr:YlxR family protein [Clostridia bacterium]